MERFLIELENLGYVVSETDNILWIEFPKEKRSERTMRKIDKDVRSTGYRNSYGIKFVHSEKCSENGSKGLRL